MTSQFLKMYSNTHKNVFQLEIAFVRVNGGMGPGTKCSACAKSIKVGNSFIKPLKS